MGRIDMSGRGPNVVVSVELTKEEIFDAADLKVGNEFVVQELGRMAVCERQSEVRFTPGTVARETIHEPHRLKMVDYTGRRADIAEYFDTSVLLGRRADLSMVEFITEKAEQ